MSEHTCLMCKEELPLDELCGDVEGSAGRLLQGCKHLYCVACVRALPEDRRRCTLCDEAMHDIRFHSCRACAWALLVEAGGAGHMRFARLSETYDIEESKRIIDVGGQENKIRSACLKEVLRTLPCYRPEGVRKAVILERLHGGAAWYPLFEGQEDPAEDMWIATSADLIHYLRATCAVVGGSWEGAERAYYGFKITGGTVLGKRHCIQFAGSILSKAPPPRLVVAVDEFFHRMGWMKE